MRTPAQGRGNAGPLVVLVHGFVGSSSYFVWLAKCLVEKYRRRVLRFDNYGRGNSGCHGDPHTARLFAGQLAEVHVSASFHRLFSTSLALAIHHLRDVFRFVVPVTQLLNKHVVKTQRHINHSCSMSSKTAQSPIPQPLARVARLKLTSWVTAWAAASRPRSQALSPRKLTL